MKKPICDRLKRAALYRLGILFATMEVDSGDTGGGHDTDGHDPGFQESGDVQMTMFQCSQCRYTSPHKTHVQTHMKAKCPSATMLQKKCVMVFKSQATTTNNAGRDIQMAGRDINNVTNVTVQPVFYVGSDEERAELFKLFSNPEVIKELATCAPTEIPATLFRLWKGADAPGHLKNITVKGDRIEQIRGPDRVVSVPRTKFVKETVGDMLTVAGDMAEDEIKDELHEPAFKCGRRREVSRVEAARMCASSAPETYRLDTRGREFLKKSKEYMDRELEYYAQESKE